MAKPPSSNRSIRLTDDAWAWVKAAAEGRDMSVNGFLAYVVNYHRSGVGRIEPKPQRAERRPEPRQAPPSKGDPPYTPRPPKVSSVQYGPTPLKFGQRQKGSKK